MNRMLRFEAILFFLNHCLWWTRHIRWSFDMNTKQRFPMGKIHNQRLLSLQWRTCRENLRRRTMRCNMESATKPITPPKIAVNILSAPFEDGKATLWSSIENGRQLQRLNLVALFLQRGIKFPNMTSRRQCLVSRSLRTIESKSFRYCTRISHHLLIKSVILLVMKNFQVKPFLFHIKAPKVFGSWTMVPRIT